MSRNTEGGAQGLTAFDVNMRRKQWSMDISPSQLLANAYENDSEQQLNMFPWAASSSFANSSKDHHHHSHKEGSRGVAVIGHVKQKILAAGNAFMASATGTSASASATTASVDEKNTPSGLGSVLTNAHETYMFAHQTQQQPGKQGAGMAQQTLPHSKGSEVQRGVKLDDCSVLSVNLGMILLMGYTAVGLLLLVAECLIGVHSSDSVFITLALVPPLMLLFAIHLNSFTTLVCGQIEGLSSVAHRLHKCQHFVTAACVLSALALAWLALFLGTPMLILTSAMRMRQELMMAGDDTVAGLQNTMGDAAFVNDVIMRIVMIIVVYFWIVSTWTTRELLCHARDMVLCVRYGVAPRNGGGCEGGAALQSKKGSSNVGLAVDEDEPQLSVSVKVFTVAVGAFAMCVAFLPLSAVGGFVQRLLLESCVFVLALCSSYQISACEWNCVVSVFARA